MTNPITFAARHTRHLGTLTALGFLLAITACGSATDAVLANAPGTLTLTIDGLIDGVTPSVELLGPNGYQKTIRHSGTIENLDLGTYQIQASPTTAQSTTWSPTSATQSITLSSGAPAASALVRYQLATGALDLRIEGLPASTGPAVHLSGPVGFTLDLASTAVLRGLAPGTYTLTAASRTIGSSVYFPADSVRTVNVAASLVPATATFSYSRAMAALEIVVTGLPAGALGQYSLTGPGSFSSAVSTESQVENLDPGDYVALPVPIVWEGHTWSPLSPSYPVVVNPGTNQVEIPYTISTGALDVEIEGLPSDAQAQYTITGPDGFSRSGDAALSLVGLWPGTYTVTAMAVSRGGRQFKPRRTTQTITMTPGLTPKHGKVEYSAESGAIAMTIAGLPGNVRGRVIVRGSSSIDTLAATETLDGLPPDTYQITAETVSEAGTTYTATPVSQSKVLAAGDTAYGAVVYAGLTPPPPTAPTGALAITVSGLPTGANAAVTVTGPGGYSQAVTGGTTLAGLPTGTYTITALGVSAGGNNFTATPATQTASISAGNTASRAVTYAPAPSGGANGLTITVEGLPGGGLAGVTVTGPAGYIQNVTGTTTLTGLATGMYTIAAAAVTMGGTSYAATVDSPTAWMQPGNYVDRTVSYAASSAPTTGSLTVTVTGLPSGTSGNIAVTASGGYSQTVTATTTLGNLAAATYTIAAQPVTAGGTTYNPTPVSQTAAIGAGGSATRSVVYAAAAPSTGTLSLTVTGLPSGTAASLTVTGPGGYSQAVTGTTSLGGLTAGTYTITSQSVSAGGNGYNPTPSSQTASVTAGATTTKSVVYAVAPPTTGSLALSVSGLPGGAAASLSVTGPGGYSQSVTGSTTLGSLVTGSYTITAQTVNAGGNSYAPTPASQGATISAGATASRSVAYAIVTGGGGGPADVTVDESTRYQTMLGWEADAQAGNESSGYNGWKNTLMDQAVNDLGITRLRVEVKANAEPTNDNASPDVINMAGFNWSELDAKMSLVVLPLRQRVLARGEPFYMNLNYVGFRTQPGHLHSNPQEYAEFVTAAFIHLRDTFGVVPDAMEIILEPDNGTWALPYQLGSHLVAAATKLAANGFHPDFIAPSTVSMANAATWFDQMMNTPGVSTYLTDISYHRYVAATDANLQAIASRAAAHGMRTAMLEHIGSGVDDLYKDLTIGNNSSWQQYTLAYPTSDNGAQYYTITNGQPVMGSRTKLLWQYFHYVRPGAQRVRVTSSSAGIRPVAFTNPGGGMAVVLHVDAAGTYSVGGLRAGTYEVTHTSAAGNRTTLPSVTATAGGTVSVHPTSTGVLTLARVP